MSQIVFFGIDLGTTNTKVIAVKESGEFIASARRATDWIVLPNGRIEADADLLYKKVVDLTKKVEDLENELRNKKDTIVNIKK